MLPQPKLLKIGLSLYLSKNLIKGRRKLKYGRHKEHASKRIILKLFFFNSRLMIQGYRQMWGNSSFPT